MKVGFTCSCFDLLHAGHIAMLQEAKTVCDYLIVGLQTDPSIDGRKVKPIQSIYERYLQLEGCKYVDKIVPYDTEEDLYCLLVTLPIDIRIIGVEYQFDNYTGKGIHEVYYNKRAHQWSSSSLRDRVIENGL